MPETTKPTRRAKGDGSIYETADGRYRAAVTLANGKRKYVSGRNRRDVSAKMRKLQAQITTTGTVDASTKLRDYLDEWLVRERVRVRPATWLGREQNVRLYIVPELGGTTLAKLTPADVERMTAAVITSGKSPRTASHIRATLSKALQEAVRDGLVGRNVAQLARPPHVPRKPIEYFDTSQLRQLLSAAHETWLGPLVTVAVTTGMRQGELFGLSWSDVDLERRTLTVRRAMAVAHGWGRELAEPKTGRSARTLHLTAQAVAAFRRLPRTGDLVFTDELGRPLTSWRIGPNWRKLVADAGLPPLPFRSCRHSCATALLTAGVDIAVVAEQLGHSQISTTASTYAAVVPSLRRDAADTLERTLG